MPSKLPLLRVRKKVVAWLIGQAVPILNGLRRPQPWPYSLAEMSQLPAGSLGAETAVFLKQRNFSMLPQYEIHDMIHTLLAYGTSTTEELRLQAFMWGNNSASFEGRGLFLLGLALLPELWPIMRADYRRGRRAAYQLSQWDFLALIACDMAHLRFQLEPPFHFSHHLGGY